MNWQQTADGNYCPAHNHKFGALEYCPDCDIGGSAGDEANPRPDNSVARSDEELARTVRDEILTLARGFQDQREENESKDRVGFSTVAKLYDTALKWHRAATGERGTRDDQDFAAWLVEEKRRMSGGGSAH